MKMEGEALVWETIRENAVGDVWGRKTQNNKVISNESHNQIARSPTFTFLPPQMEDQLEPSISFV